MNTAVLPVATQTVILSGTTPDEVLTEQELIDAMPDKLRKMLSQTAITHILNTLKEPDMFQQYRDNMFGFSNIMLEGKFKFTDYINAIKYCSYKLGGMTNQDAYIKTFPDKYQAWLQQGVDPKTMSAYVAMYHKTQMVTKILSQAAIPIQLLNQDVAQKAINHLAHLMVTAKSEMVQANSAIALLNHLKLPDTAKVQVDVNIKQSDAIQELTDQMRTLVETQVEAMNLGVSAKQIAGSKLIEHGEVV